MSPSTSSGNGPLVVTMELPPVGPMVNWVAMAKKDRLHRVAMLVQIELGNVLTQLIDIDDVLRSPGDAEADAAAVAEALASGAESIVMMASWAEGLGTLWQGLEECLGGAACALHAGGAAEGEAGA